MLNDRLVIVFQNAIDAGRQPATADFVARMGFLLDGENGQAGTAQLVGGSGTGRPHTDNHGIVGFDVRQSTHWEEEV